MESPTVTAKLAWRASGAPFVTWAGFDSAKFTFTRGQPASYASSSHVLWFLQPVRHSVNGAIDVFSDLPDSVDVTVGSLDTPEDLRPEDHTWTESRLSWIALSDQLPNYLREKKPQ